MMILALNWLRKNVNLVLLLAATTCQALALGEMVRGVAWSLLVPVSLSAVACSWGLGGSRFNLKQAWVSLTVLGILGVFIYVGGLTWPLRRMTVAMLSLIPQIVLWISDKVLIDFVPLLATWTELGKHAAGVLIRTWEWSLALSTGKPIFDPLAAGLVWSLLLWFVGAWAGWQMRWSRQALQALAPGAVLLALVLDYTHGDTWLVIVYLAILLTLMGMARNEWLHIQWRQRKVDYAESIVIDTLTMVGGVAIVLVLSAAGAPSLSWHELMDKLREKDRVSEDQIAESLGLEAPPNAANKEAYRSGGLPRQHLLSMPPEQLEDVVLTISTGELPPMPESVLELPVKRYYWRSITYDFYSGAGWSSSSARDVPFPPNTPLLEPPQEYRLLIQHIKRTPGQSESLYWTGLLAQVDTGIDIAWRTPPPVDPNPTRSGDMLGALTDADEYTVESYLPQINVSQLRATASDYPPEINRRYLQLPASTPERVLALAREITQVAPTPYDRVAAIETYLRTFPYTLEVRPPPSDRDLVDYFLFTAQQGYCDYYAASMVVLARAAGLPARVVIGYASGEYDAPTAEYIVRQKDAHTWVEVYFSGIGWVEFEPTAGQPAIDRLGDESTSDSAPELPASLSAITWLKTHWRTLISTLGGQFIFGGIGVVFLLFLWQVGEMWYLQLIPSHEAISWIYSHLERISARLLPGLPNGHTPHQLQIALIQKLKSAKNRSLRIVFSSVEFEIESVVTLYMAQVFSQQPPGKSQIIQGIRSWTRLRWRLWIALGWWRYHTGRSTDFINNFAKW